MPEGNYGRQTTTLLDAIRKRQPLIHHITNFVVMNSTANVTLAIGASPIMAHAPDEVADIAAFASVLNLNIGTLDASWIEAMLIAGRAAAERHIPIVFDPVGVGATPLRSRAAARILDELPVSVIRGNAAEIMALAGATARIRGVDSLESTTVAHRAAIDLARRASCVVAVTGAVDYISDGKRALEVHNGHPMFSRVTGTGCAATTAISCFCSVGDNHLLATACALAYYGACGEIAGAASAGPGSFQLALLDALYNLSGAELEARVRIHAVDV